MSILSNTLPAIVPALTKRIGRPRTVIDVGAGVRPADWFGARHICVEPSVKYAAVLRKHGYETINETAIEGLPSCPEADVVLMFDVIEHMEREEALESIALARAKGRVFIYTPLGFVEQNTDDWGYGEHGWQTHRSGWTPADFAGWRIVMAKKNEGFLAICAAGL